MTFCLDDRLFVDRLESGFGSCVELCNRTSSFCSVAICRDTFVSSTPVDAAIVTSSSFSSGADKTVAQSKSQAITKLCGSGKGTGGTGASAGSDTLNKRKKRKKKRKRRPAEMQIPWVHFLLPALTRHLLVLCDNLTSNPASSANNPLNYYNLLMNPFIRTAERYITDWSSKSLLDRSGKGRV